MDAEHMREICPRGKGSRGGGGSRKRRNGGKDSTRKLGAGEEEAESIRLQTLDRSLCAKVTPGHAEAADEVLKKHLAKPIRTDDPVHMWNDISQLDLQRLVLKGDKQYRAALDLVIALKAKVVASGQIKRHCRLMQEALSESQNRPQNWSRKFKIVNEDDLVRAISRLTIDFGVPFESDTKKVSRFVASVRFLTGKGVAPGGVEKFYEEYGGGLDEWHRSADAAMATKKLKLAAAAREVESQKSKKDNWDEYLDEGPTSGTEKWSVMTREEHRLVKLSGVGRWECSLLQYFKSDKKIEDGEVMVAVVVGDVKAPSEVRLVKTVSLGDVTGSPTLKILRLKNIIRSIRTIEPNRLRGTKKISGHQARPPRGAADLGVEHGRPYW